MTATTVNHSSPIKQRTQSTDSLGYLTPVSMDTQNLHIPTGSSDLKTVQTEQASSSCNGENFKERDIKSPSRVATNNTRSLVESSGYLEPVNLDIDSSYLTNDGVTAQYEEYDDVQNPSLQQKVEDGRNNVYSGFSSLENASPGPRLSELIRKEQEQDIIDNYETSGYPPIVQPDGPSTGEHVYEMPNKVDHGTYQQLVINGATSPKSEGDKQIIGIKGNGVNSSKALDSHKVETKIDVYVPSKYFSIMTLTVSIVHIILAVVAICLQIVVDVKASPLSRGQGGIILGCLSGIVGILGISAYKVTFNRVGITISMLIIAILSAIGAFLLMIIAPIDMILTAADNENGEKQPAVTANGILILVAFLEIIVTIWAAVIGCIGSCTCCKPCGFEIRQELSDSGV